MDRELKRFLQKEFEAPKPVRKERFFRNVGIRPIGYFEFLRTQAAYIRKWIWLLSGIVFGSTVLGATGMKKDMLWCMTALMPVLALTVITESGRSEACGMAEFELSTRFSLKSVVLARLAILGGANLLLICLLLPIVAESGTSAIFRTGVYMLCPYFLTVFLGLWSVRRIRGRENIYVCAGIAAAVSIGGMCLYWAVPFFYDGSGMAWWTAALVITAAGALRQGAKMIRQTEELAWNL